MKKKIDARLKTLLEVSCQNNHRALLVIIGDRGKNQVVNLHYMLSKISNIPKPSVLWCYKKELGFSSHRKKRMKQIKKLAQRGLLDTSRDDPFEIFVSNTHISSYSEYFSKDSGNCTRQLYTMAMDVHDRFRTQAHKDVVAS
ncbi:N-acetyltransferase 10 [Galdieria sulphuraria]|nr:N-acetyltransferase 10 [Galdieria sulphuraria]